MISAPLARASFTSFATFGTEAVQRGRRSLVQVWLVKSITSSAVSLGAEIVAGLSCGAAGSFAVLHSSTMVCAAAGKIGPPVDKRQAPMSVAETHMRCMNLLPDCFANYRVNCSTARVVRGCVWSGYRRRAD